MKSVNKQGMVVGLCGVLVLILAVFGYQGRAYAEQLGLQGLPVPEGATYVGTEACASCHEKQYQEYQLSTHSRIELACISSALLRHLNQNRVYTFWSDRTAWL